MNTTRTLRIALSLGILFAVSLLLPRHASAQKIEWLGLEQALTKAESAPRPIIVDLYTDWCGWCKKMDVYTFENKGIVKYINEHFYAAKFDAESAETITYRGKKFEGAKGRGVHSLATHLVGKRMGFPTLLYLQANGELITVVGGYKTPSDLEPILHFIASGKYANESWEDFIKGFKSQL